MISEIVQLLKQLPAGAQARVRDFAQAELTRLKAKAQKRRGDWQKRQQETDPPMYREAE